MTTWVDVYYNKPGYFGKKSWASGSQRMELDKIGEWLVEQNDLVLVTHIEPLEPKAVELFKELRGESE